MTMIEVKGISKRFTPSILAVDGVSFSVSAGEVVGFLGPNGAGKSTTMKMITGFLTPTAGWARVAGFDSHTQTIEAQTRLGYLPEGAPAYPDMTPAGFLDFAASARDLKGSARKEAIARAVDRTNLRGVLHQSIDTLSKGFKRRVGLAQAILHDPGVLIMDEPTDGLDPNQKHEVRQLIRGMAKSGSGGGGESGGGKAILLSTHILEEVEAVCTRAIVISKGRIVADCTPAELLAKSRYHHALTMTLHAPAGAHVREEMLNVAGVRNVESEGQGGGVVSVTVFPKDTAKAGAVTSGVLALCQSRGWRVEGVRVEDGRMDEVFRELTSGGRS